MGTAVKTLYVSEKKVVPNKNLVIGVDLTLFIHKFFAVYKTRNAEPFATIIDNKKEYTSHLYGLFKSFEPISQNNTIVFIMDKNSSLGLKRNTREKRRSQTEKRERRIQKYLEDPRTFELAKKESMKRTHYIINQKLLEEVFRDVGWNLIYAELADAEKLGATMITKGILDYFITTDSDTLLFGSDYVKQIKVEGEQLKLEIISLNKTLEENKISYEELVKMGIIAGTDYSPGIPRIGPKKALAYLQNNKFPEELSEIYSYFTSRDDIELKKPLTLSFNKENYLKWVTKLNITLDVNY